MCVRWDEIEWGECEAILLRTKIDLKMKSPQPGLVTHWHALQAWASQLKPHGISIVTLALGIQMIPAVAHATNIDVYIIAGQSNAGGYGTDGYLSGTGAPYGGALASTQSNKYFWYANDGAAGIAPGASSAAVVPLGPGLGTPNDNAHFGAELSFGYNIPGPAYIIKYSWGGTSLEGDWIGGSNYESDMVTQVGAALTAIEAAPYGFTPVIKGIIWIQGEADASQASSTYANDYLTNLKTFVDYINSNLGTAGVPWVISSLNSHQAGSSGLNGSPTAGGDWSTVVGAQQAFPTLNPSTELALTVSTEDLSMITGNIEHYQNPSYITLGARLAAAVLNPPASGVAGSRFSNFSLQGFCGTSSSQNMTVGLTTSVNGDMPVLVRAVGDGLSAFGISGTMSSPKIAGYNSAAQAISDFADNPSTLSNLQSSLGAFTLSGTDVCGVANLLTSGGYSFSVTPSTGGFGDVEIWAAGASGFGGTISNLAGLGYLRSGSDTLVMGFIISGSTDVNLLVRAIGPGLSALGISGDFPDPSITVKDSSGNTVASNDNWPSSLSSTFSSAGAFSLTTGSNDAALLISGLAPGTYSAVITGGSSSSPSDSGRVLGELYLVP